MNLNIKWFFIVVVIVFPLGYLVTNDIAFSLVVCLFQAVFLSFLIPLVIERIKSNDPTFYDRNKFIRGTRKNLKIFWFMFLFVLTLGVVGSLIFLN